MTGSEPNPEGVADDVLRELEGETETASPEQPPKPKNKGGRPKGSGKKTGPAKRPPASSERPEPEPTNPLGEDEGRLLGSTVWNLLAPYARLEPLDEEEAGQLGKALTPVLNKYLPMLGGFEAELVLFLTVATLYQKKRVPKETEIQSPDDDRIILPDGFGKGVEIG